MNVCGVPEGHVLRGVCSLLSVLEAARLSSSKSSVLGKGEERGTSLRVNSRKLDGWTFDEDVE